MNWGEIYESYQYWLLLLCLIALGASLFVLFVGTAITRLWEKIRAYLSLPSIEIVLTGVVMCGLVHYASTKQICYIGYSNGIKAGAAVSVVTNDTVCIYWQRDTSGGVYIPEDATVYIDYRSNTETNAEWVLLAQTTVGAWGWCGTVQNATNYDYSVWAYYIPPEPVHTNGVWVYKTHFDRKRENAIPLRARVDVNGKAIATPKEARKNEE